MEIRKENDTTSCNFCQKGELNKNQIGSAFTTIIKKDTNKTFKTL